VFRDDRDAMLARLEALEAEKARLEERVEERTAERDQALEARDQAIEARDQARAAVPPPPTPPRPARASQRSSFAETRTRNGIILGGLLLVGMGVAATIKYGCADEPAAPGASAEDRLVPLRRCLDNADLAVRAFLAEPAGRRHDLVRANAHDCLRALDAQGDELAGMPRAYRDAFAAILPDVERLTVYYESEQFEADHGALGAEIIAGLADRVAAWKQASAKLRPYVSLRLRPLRSRAFAHHRVHGPPGALEGIIFADTAQVFLDLLADDSTTAAALEEELGWLHEHRRRAGQYASGGMSSFIDYAEKIVALVATHGGPPIRAETAVYVEVLGQVYDANGYGRPDPS
jgi:hypothetical protein